VVATVHANHFPPLRLCGIYSPNSKQDEFIRRVLSTVAADATVVMGDFNFVSRVVDRSPPAQLDTVAISCLDAISSAGFFDISPLRTPHNFVHRNGRYTARLDRCYVNHINENHIPGIRKPDGGVSTRQEDIHNSFHSFYSDLYSPKPTSTTRINKHIPRLPPELITSLTNPFTIADVLCVARKAKKNSAPGPDGIPYSLYERVPILQVLLVKFIQASIQTSRFPPSWSLSYIRPILKPGKDPLLASSYRPIALLCTDYKIFSSVIAGRFKLYLPPSFLTTRVAT